jgi:exonuclease III
MNSLRPILYACGALVVLGVAVRGERPAGFKVAFYNIRSGQGVQPLRGHPAPFADGSNCDPASGKPLNAWGTGIVQRELDRLAADSQVVALGVAEAWTCASPRNVAKALRWRRFTGERNGTALLARYGFAGDDEWRQLDTSQNTNARDQMWVVRAAVCLDERCTSTVDVYTGHWYGTGPQAQATLDRQAEQTVDFMRASRGPHVLVGDLNVFEGPSVVCRQKPNNTSLQILRNAGYVDAWPTLHPNDPGFTGMLNRPGCGSPDGAPWKRIDYAWSKGLTPVAMDRFGLPTPGDAAPSDHAGILAEYRF